ncbi:hypothetical protein SAMN02745165_02271 [Malonomonas rubra DSM 5091]|uniref:Uncharacterized protein n=1 Tax=Malonomonas rubra DSM 5091 TaxID=1122189 RepID=A0A1M6IWE9_MALRU|nr:hypothetical protein [Malonomonas rubra]SHJ38795.1 hypothetical protein SAMN02745165_02271 [Malonomonas rubra DSM 5091]
MDFAALIPTPDAIPVDWGWFYVLLMVTFLLHLLVMNAMLGGGIIALFSLFQGGEQNNLLGKEVGYKLPYTIAFAVNMGVAPLLFVQVLFGQFIYSSSVMMAVWWLSIIGLLILAYYAAYIYDFKFDALQGLRTLVLIFSVGILLFIGFMFSNNMTLMLQPEKWVAYLSNPGGTLLNAEDPTLWPRYLHFVIGAVAIAGLFLALVGHFGFTKSKVDPATLIERGMSYFTKATIIQIFIGLWFLVALPKEVMMVFMGKSAYGTALLTIGLVLAVALVYFGLKRNLLLTSVVALIQMVVMILMRDLARFAYLKPYFHPADLQVTPEYSPLIFFLVVFAIGLVLIGYMIKLALGCKKEVA